MVSGTGKPFGTCARVAGSFVSVASPAASLWGNRHYSPSAVCGRSTPTCRHWEAVKMDKRKAGQGGSAKSLPARPTSNADVESRARAPPTLNTID